MSGIFKIEIKRRSETTTLIDATTSYVSEWRVNILRNRKSPYLEMVNAFLWGSIHMFFEYRNTHENCVNE